MKKLFAIFTLILTISTATIQRDAKAAIGVVSLNPSIVLGGLAAGGVGYLGMVELFKRDGSEVLGIGGLLGFIFGVVLLDGENGQEISFQKIGTEEGTSIGLTDSELTSFNQNIDQINAVLEEVTYELNEIEDPTLEDSYQAWQSYGLILGETTLIALKKIVSQR